MSDQDNNRYLVPLDLSRCSAELVQHAAAEAAAAGAGLVLLHVGSVPGTVSARAVVSTPGGPRDVGSLMHDDGLRRLEPYIRQAGAQGVEATPMVALGEPAAQILAAAGEVGARRIIMGTHGRQGLSRLMLGSVAERVSRRAEVPVQTLRTRRKPDCDARSCSWCAVSQSDAQQQVLAEAEG